MKAKDKVLIDRICLDICPGYNGRCQRYPGLARSCEDFVHLETAYQAGAKDTIRWIESHPLIKPDENSITRFEPFYQIEQKELENYEGQK